MFDPLVIEEISADIHITQWDNVRYATIVNGELVPGALINSPYAVEGVNAGTNAATCADAGFDTSRAPISFPTRPTAGNRRRDHQRQYLGADGFSSCQ